MGEAKRKALRPPSEAIALDTFGGRIHVEWDPAAAVTPLEQLPLFIEFLKVSGLFQAWVADCPLTYTSNFVCPVPSCAEPRKIGAVSPRYSQKYRAPRPVNRSAIQPLASTRRL